MFVEIFLLVIGLALFFVSSTRRPKNFPPGPPRLPILGSITYLQPNLFRAIQRMKKKYGGIFSLYLGSDPVVIVTDYNLYKEAMSNDTFIDRASIGYNNEFMRPDKNGDRCGILFANGKTWQEQRRFCQRQLKDFGFGRIGMEPLIQEEVEKCINMLSMETGKVTSLKLKLNVAILNALWHILTGEKLGYEDPRCKEVIRKFYIMMSSTTLAGPLFLFPWLRHILPDQLGYTNQKQANDAVCEMINESFEEHMETFEPEYLRDFTDAYLKEMSSNKYISHSSFGPARGRDNYIVNMSNLFVGGSETTSNTINYTLWYLCKHPDVQIKLQNEIDNVVGRSKLPSMDDSKKIPYLEAVTYEAQRITGIFYTGIFRVASKDTEIGGYSIPKGTRLGYGIYEIQNDVSYWKDPEVFRPDRFLRDGKFHLDERFVAFGIGRRNCMGKTLALNELFLFLSALVQRFSFSFPNDYSPKDIEPEVGFILTCPDYPIILNERQ